MYRVGELLNGTYEIRQFIGAGGMGQVFEAHDRVLNRRVAIKVAHAGAPPGLLRKEAQALAAVRHTSMITVHAVGEHRGVEFMVMERIYGISLDDHIEARLAAGESFSVNETLELLIAVAEGLSVIHGSGIAHRDVKPGNIMIAPGRRVVLMDFGLVLPEFEVAAQTSIAGSPRYMAPEAIANTVEPGAGHLVDLYALGVIGYRMLAGEPPYDADSFEALCRLHLEAEVPDVRRARPDVPEALALLLRSMLDKNPRARPPSADSLALRFRQIRDRGVEPKRAPALPKNRLSVLVVDDDPDLLKVLPFYVRKAMPDAEVRTASDGERALEAIRAHAPDVMLLDLQMPKMNGIELCMYLRGTHFADACTIVSVSAGAQPHDQALLQQLGIRHFLTKGRDLGSHIAKVLHEVRPAREPGAPVR